MTSTTLDSYSVVIVANDSRFTIRNLNIARAHARHRHEA